ncbi:MAG: DHA2 family efflux MFS transporter permease subunit [Rhizobiales bacterium]|nr:DHA2 family efflux MFS transporter permease subunit [Hyphomicrobiales bacterium]
MAAATTTIPTSAPRAAASGFDMRRLIAFIAMVFGMFMAILDIQIVSASLSDIQAGLSASVDEISWVQTAYLIAEVIMIPLSGTLSRMMSTRILFTLSASGFTLASVLCAQATSINEMIIFRAFQGFIGGAMIPTVFAASFTIFPASKRPIITPLIGLIATLAPTIGPTVGGYLTDLFSWHWLFLVNVGPGIVVVTLVWFLVDFDEPDWSLFKGFDWLGLAAMALFLGTAEYVLEEGPSNDWFDDAAVSYAAIAFVVGMAFFFWRTFTARQPIVDLSAFSNRNFATGAFFSFVMGIGLYGLTYLYPVFLSRVRGYSSMMIGETMFVTGIAMFIAAPIVGRLSTKVDPRIMMALGFGGFALGTWQASFVTKDWSFNELLIPQILRGFCLMLCMVPITNAALGTLAPSRIKNASGLFNLTRNLGGAVGLALINTALNDRMDLHLQRLREQVSWGRDVAVSTLNTMTQAFSPLGSDASNAAVTQMARIVRREATVMAIGDVFLLLTLLFAAIVVLTPLMQRPKSAAGDSGH